MASWIGNPRFRLAAGVGLLAIVGVVVWLWLTSDRESTDDAQVDAHVTQIAPRVGGTIVRGPVNDDQQVAAGAVLVGLDPRDYGVALDRARAELADAEATAVAAQSNVPIASTTASSNVSSAEGSVEQAQGGVEAAQKEIEAARARLTTAQARLREAEAHAPKAARDVERLRGLRAKAGVPQQQLAAAVAAPHPYHAAADRAHSKVAEAEAGIRVAETKLVQAQAGGLQARA